ncbi:MAG: hypothetical protein HZB16_23915 [Armatimonadetes bacterium]|nr:hypothetical protein [Armatimonadota bacterium]
MRTCRRLTLLLCAAAVSALIGCGGSKAIDLSGSTGDLTISATTGAIEARVVNANNSPYANQTILVSGTRAATTAISATTDGQGWLRLGSLSAGSYQLLAGAVSFSVDVTANAITTRRLNVGNPTEVRTDLGLLYVLNGLGKTLSVIDTDAGTITNNVVNTGQWPNQVAFHKSIGYVVNSGDNKVQRFNPAGGATIDNIDVGTGANPYSIAFSGDKAYITNLLTNSVSVANVAGATPTVSKTVTVGTAPEGMAVARGKVFVCCANYAWTGGAVTYGHGEVHVINATTDTVEAVLDLGADANPQAAVVGADGAVYVLCTGNFGTVGSRVLRINARTNTLDGSPLALTTGTAAVTTAGAMALAPNGRCFITDTAINRVHVIDTNTNTVLRTGAQALDMGGNPLGVAASDNGVVWVFNFSADQVRSADAATYAQRFAPLDAGDGPQTGGTRSRVPGLGLLGTGR